ncbi:F-box protein At1g80960-like [Panicum virgatum]|uniref:F-box protein At1g80960-like n=1 Tax=Panicum virgatum TaxID=38727 RepID=UPI0019D6668D|nr:F-box protein At1g80960-like [Panicum virgatum]
MANEQMQTKREPERKRRRNKEINTCEGPNLISRLPDDVLGAIVTLLIPDEGARTTILSRRWRYVWRFAPLNLVDSLKSVDFSHQRIQVLSQILATHPSPARRLATRSLDLGRNISLYDHWKELEELVVEDAASLERLLLHELDNGMSVRTIGATKLKMIGYLATGFPIFALNNSNLKSMVPVSLVEQFSTVEILALHMPDLPKLKVVIAYLRCFPCLEKLKIKGLGCMKGGSSMDKDEDSS